MNRDERDRDRGVFPGGRGGHGGNGRGSHSSQWNGHYGRHQHLFLPQPNAHLQAGGRPMQRGGGGRDRQSNWQSRPFPPPPQLHARGGQVMAFPMQGGGRRFQTNQPNWPTSRQNSLPPPPPPHLHARDRQGNRDVGKKRPFGTNLTNQRFDPPAPKNARLYSPPHRSQLDDSLLRNLRYLIFDEEGSRRLEQVLDEGGSTAATTILNEGLPFWADAMVRPYSNYLFQKILERIIPDERVTLVQSVRTRLVYASCNKLGSLTIRRIVEVCSIKNKEVSREEAACNHIVFKVLTDALRPYAVRLCVDTYATFVIQCILLKLPYQYTRFIFDEVAINIEDVACNRNGRIVVRCCLDSCHSEALTQVGKRLVENSFDFMQNAHAVLTVQKALDVCGDDEVRVICESVVGNVCQLAVHKYGNHAIQQCLERCSDEIREQYLCELIDSGRIQEVMINPFGSYFVQKALSVATNEQATRLVESMRPYFSSWNDTNVGVRKILCQICERFPSFNLDDCASHIESSTALVESSPNETGSSSGISTTTSRDVPNDVGASTSRAAAISGNANVSSALAAQPPSVPDGEASSHTQQNLAEAAESPSDQAGSSSSASASASAAQPPSDTNKPEESHSSNQSQSTAVASANTVSTPRDAPDRTRPTATPRSSSKILDVVEPAKEFWVRPLFSEEETKSRLKDTLNKTDAYLRREMGLPPTTRYPEAIERVLQEIYGLTTEFALDMRKYIAANCPNGQFELQKLDKYDKDEQGGYSISSSDDVDKTKTGSACGKDGIPGRSGDQVPSGTDLNKYVGVLFTLKGIKGILESNEELEQLANRIYQLLPWAGSYIPYRFDYVLNNLAEVAFGSFLPGDARLLGEWILYGGNKSVHDLVRRPPTMLNARAASNFINTIRFRVLMTWARQISQIFEQVTQRETFDGRSMSNADIQMVEAMVYFNPNFTQKHFIYDRLLNGLNASVKVDKHKNAVSRSPIDAAMAELTGRAREILTPESVEDVDVQGLKQVLKEGLVGLWRPGKTFYWLEQELSGDLQLLARKTARLLVEWIAESQDSDEKTVILAERIHLVALKQFLPAVYKSFFGEDKLVVCIKCVDGEIAGHLYSTSVRGLQILVLGSYFVINAMGRPFGTRLTLCKEFVAVKSTFASAGLLENIAVDETEQHLQSFLHQLDHPLSKMEIYAIQNNIVEEYHHGNAGKEGLRAMINILKEELGLGGIYDEIMTTLALHLGSVDLQKLFAVLGHTIDCSNMKKTLRRLKRKQGDQGVMPASRRQSLRQARTGSTQTEESIRKMSQTKTQLTKQVKADRNSQYDKYIQKHQLVEREMSTIWWDRQKTTWDVRLRRQHFDGNQINVGCFKQLSDATAAMKHLDEVLKDKSKREDETFVDEVIKHVRSNFNACYHGGKWQVSEIENIL